MGIYASRPGKLAGQLIADAFVVVWSIVWAFAGTLVHQTVGQLAAPARQTARAATRLASDFRDAADKAATVPGVGAELRRPFDAAAGTLGGVISSANEQVVSIERLALIVGWLVFLIPFSIVVTFWLPRRVRFFRQTQASQLLLDSGVDLDLFALRAMANQPLYVLAKISSDPVKAWRAGDRAVIDQLADTELRRNGLRRPERASRGGTGDPGDSGQDAVLPG